MSVQNIPNIESFLDIDDSIQNTPKIILYHSTDTDLYERIRQRGLEPREVSGQDSNYSHDVAFQRDKIFLGTKELVRTPKISEAYARKMGKKTTTVVILGIRISTDNLFQDCDIFFNEGYDDTQARRICWYDGLKTNQSCSYQGVILQEQIVSVDFEKRIVKYS